MSGRTDHRDGGEHESESPSSMKPPASTVEEASSKGLLEVDAVRGMYEKTAEDYLKMVKADESNESAIGPTHAALKRLYELMIPNDGDDEGGEGGDSAAAAAAPPLVDVGCGPGTNLLWLSKQVEYRTNPRPLIGLDLSPTMIDLARKELSSSSSSNDDDDAAGGDDADESTDIDFRVGNMLELDLPDSSVTGMCNGCCIQHVDLDGVRRTLKEAARVLLPSGILLLQFWTGEDRPMPGPEGAAFVGWKLDTVRDAVRATERLALSEESHHVYEEFDMPYAFFYIRKD